MTDNVEKLPTDTEYEALFKSNNKFGREALILTYTLAVKELSFYMEKEELRNNEFNYNRNQ